MASKPSEIRREPSGGASPPAKLPTDRRHSDSAEDQRHKFSRDRDRVLYSLPFRRLAGVTQVVHAAEGHIFHNRLTHSLKVAQVGRRIAEYLISDPTSKEVAKSLEINPDVVETAGLAHDLGHPPFGHIAEEELDTLLRKNNISDGFEGNPQSFRVVTKVAVRDGQNLGLNLTRASLNAILKYPWKREKEGKPLRKWGFYYTEKQDFDFARELQLQDDVRRQCVEAALMDWADDVTYSVHDVEDFYRAGTIPLDQLLEDSDERGRFIERVRKKWERKSDKRLSSVRWANDFFDLLKEMTQIFGLLDPFSGTRSQIAGLNFLSSTLIKRFIIGDSKLRTIDLVTEKSDLKPEEPCVKIHDSPRAEVDLLKELMSEYVFENPALLAQQYGQRRVIRELFEILFEAVKPGSKNRGIIPEPFLGYMEEFWVSEDLERARLVADIIASMSEQQTLLFHQRLLGLSPGSVRDLIIR